MLNSFGKVSIQPKVCIPYYTATCKKGLLFWDPLGKCGRKCKTTPNDEAILLRNSKKNPQKFWISESFSIFWSTCDLTYSKALADTSWSEAQKPLKKQLLTEKMMKKRLAWAKKVQVLVCTRLEKSFIFWWMSLSCERESTVNMSGSVMIKSLALAISNRL